ncbi:hypothetical protein [Caenispirillum bisanense]|uniref:Uncharacterized protein n=1 Tax=Caenispirillum bisanense TaxID=414052 RepID=A0A286G5W7_9PROT|nr:hypothetical protein [Caenispirillum bisanense]SOD90893.1 hypothetical protein SAMN05421508_101705 [Caenispirillum bisanense]
MVHPMPRDDGSAAYADWRRQMDALVDSLCEAAEDARRNGPVNAQERARLIAEFNRSRQAGDSRRLQDLAESIDAAADEADRDGCVPPDELARMLAEFDRKLAARRETP